MVTSTLRPANIFVFNSHAPVQIVRDFKGGDHIKF